MKYSHFEALVLGVGGTAVLGSMALSYETLVPEEALAQLLLLGVLAAAVHYGRNAGFVAAIAASIAYVVMRMPLVMSAGGLSVDIVSIVLVRVLTYGLVGIVGGELCSRIRYVFARLEDSDSVDDWSRIFNQRFILRSLDNASGQYARYETPYSVVLIELSGHLMTDIRVARQRSLVRGVADYVRNDIRLVDEAGRLDDGRFMVVLPHTPRTGAEVVAKRLHAGVCDVLGARDESVNVAFLGTPEDTGELERLRESLREVAPAAQLSVSRT